MSGDGSTPANDGEVAAALSFLYRRVGAGGVELLDASAYAYALAEVLVRKGVLGVDELDKARRAAEKRLDERFREIFQTWLLDDPRDKYELGDSNVVIDCEARLPLCHAACCRLRFPLSAQDVEEGAVMWSLHEPYLNRQRTDGYCSHCDATSNRCTVYERRPLTCRTYDCRTDPRIWIDFERRIPNPQVGHLTGTVKPAPCEEVHGA